MAYCTDAEVKTRIGGIKGQSDDALIEALITEAQAWIDAHTNRTFEASADTTRTFDAFADVGGLTLFLDRDLAAITSVTNGDGTTVTSGQYVTEPRNDTPYYGLTLLRSSALTWLQEDDGDNEDAIAIVGKWAYSTEAPNDIKRACIQLAAFFYRSRDAGPDQDRTIIVDGMVITPGRIPREVTELLRPYRRLHFS